MLNKSKIKSIAEIFSIVSDPRLTFFILFLHFYIVRVNNHAITLIVLIILFLSLLINLILFRDKKPKDEFKFDNLALRKHRYLTYFMLLIIGIPTLAISIFLNLKIEAIFFFLLIIDTLLLLFVSKFYHYKLSAHISYLGLLILYILKEGNLKYFLFLILSLIVGYARIILKKHTFSQIFIAFMIIILIFIFFDFFNVVPA